MSFLKHVKKFVWKIKVTRGVSQNQLEEYYTGACISENGVILTHAFNDKELSHISVYDEGKEEHAASVIAHSYEDGLALLRVKDRQNCDFVEISGRTTFELGEEFHAVLYQSLSFSPICLNGFLANEGKGLRGVVGYLEEAYPIDLDLSVPVLQIAELGAADECVTGSTNFNIYGFEEGRGCPVFDNSRILVGVVAFQKSVHDFVIHPKHIKKFVSTSMDSFPSSGGQREHEEKESGRKRRRKRSRKKGKREEEEKGGGMRKMGKREEEEKQGRGKRERKRKKGKRG